MTSKLRIFRSALQAWKNEYMEFIICDISRLLSYYYGSDIHCMIKWNPYVQHHIDRCTRSPIDYVAIIMISADQSKSEQAFILLTCLVCVRHHWRHDLCDFESFEGGSVSGDLVPNGGRVSTFIAQCRWRMVANASRRQQWLIAWMFREECEET